MLPKLLTDFARLPEIYKLRVLAYEGSPYKQFINFDKYPNGFFDHLEENGNPYELEEIPIFNSERHSIASEDELLNVFWPKGENIRGRAILAVCNLLGAYDFKDGQKVNRENITKREYHHIFPTALLEETKEKGMRALNCALITDTTNRSIGKKSPFEFLKQQYNIHNHENAAYILKSHLIPIDAIDNGGYDGKSLGERIEKISFDYNNFLIQRAGLVKLAADLLCSGTLITIDKIFTEQLIPNEIEKIEEKIKSLEITFRQLLCDKLANADEDPFNAFVDEYTRSAAERKFAQDLSRNPALKLEDFNNFKTQIDSLNLGEHKALIVGKKTWQYFEPVFEDKKKFSRYFDQLTALRNKFAHVGEISPILLKEGEAAVIWLTDVLEQKLELH